MNFASTHPYTPPYSSKSPDEFFLVLLQVSVPSIVISRRLDRSLEKIISKSTNGSLDNILSKSTDGWVYGKYTK
jgi:hypothetical protein